MADPTPPDPTATARTAAEDPAALRAEHDLLAKGLEVRLSVDEVRRASIAFFLGLVGVGLCGKLGWDRWGITRPGQIAPTPQHGVPLFLYLCMAATVVALLLSIRWFVSARRLILEEDARFARFVALRDRLGVDR
jgi:hypothetical protein